MAQGNDIQMTQPADGPIRSRFRHSWVHRLAVLRGRAERCASCPLGRLKRGTRRAIERQGVVVAPAILLYVMPRCSARRRSISLLNALSPCRTTEGSNPASLVLQDPGMGTVGQIRAGQGPLWCLRPVARPICVRARSPRVDITASGLSRPRLVLSPEPPYRSSSLVEIPGNAWLHPIRAASLPHSRWTRAQNRSRSSTEAFEAVLTEATPPAAMPADGGAHSRQIHPDRTMRDLASD